MVSRFPLVKVAMWFLTHRVILRMKQENTYVRNVYTITPQQMLFLLKNIPEATVQGSLRLLLAVNFMVPRAGLLCRGPHAEEHDGDGAGMVVGDIKTSRDRGRKKKIRR